MKITIYIILLLLSQSCLAEFKLTFNHNPPQQHKDQNGKFTEKVELNLQIIAQLASEEDNPYLGSQLNYQFSCQGDAPMWTNKNNRGIHRPGFVLQMNFDNAKPLIWDTWPIGKTQCKLIWKNINTHTDSNNKSLALSATDLETAIIYDRSDIPLPFRQRNLSKPKQETFIMTKQIHHIKFDHDNTYK